MRRLDRARGRDLLRRTISFGKEEGRSLALFVSGILVLLLSLAVARACRDAAAVAPTLVPGRAATLALATLVVAAVVLNATVLSRVSEGKKSISRSGVFYIGAGTILLLAILFRIVWTRSVYFPGNTPDGYTYLLPALQSPKFPLDEARSIGFPYLISFSLAVFRHPIGILIVQNLLSVAAAVVLALGLRRCLDSDVVALLVLTYMLFCSKNVAFEYLLLSENLFRCAVAILLGSLLWSFRRRASLFYTAFLGLLTLVAILTKPSAIVLVPAVMAGLAAGRWASPQRAWKNVMKPLVVYSAVVVSVIVGYMTVFYGRFGSFQIASMTGFSLYWNVNRLTDLDGPAYPEVKRELRKFFPAYLEKHKKYGENLGDWAVWGSSSPEIERELGKQNPEKVVRAYVQTHGTGSVFHRMDRVFLDLAVEGIRAHPLKYILMSFQSTLGLLRNGLTFSYPIMPIRETADISSRVRFFRDWFFVARTPAKGIVVPEGFRPLSNQSVAILVPETLSGFLAMTFKAFFFASVAIFGLGALVAGLDRTEKERLLPLMPIGLTITLYLVFCGFLLVAEPARFLLPVQDLIVAAVLALALLGWRSIRSFAVPAV